MTGEGVAAIITATFAGILGILSFWRGYQKDKRIRERRPMAPPAEIEAGMRAVEAYKSLMGDIEADRARMRVERDTEHDLRLQVEEERDELRRRLAMYEMPGVDERDARSDG